MAGSKMTNSPTTTFEPVEMKVGKGWYVLATPPRGSPIRLGGFNSEDEARDWIRRKASTWLKDQ
jgi:hypothetical protein